MHHRLSLALLMLNCAAATAQAHDAAMPPAQGGGADAGEGASAGSVNLRNAQPVASPSVPEPSTLVATGPSAVMDESAALPPPPPPAGLPGVVVRAIIVNGARDIPRKEMDAALSTFVGHRLTQDDMQDLLSTLSGLARARGYVFARSSIPAQTLDSGVLHVDLDEGRVDEVRLTGQANKAVRAILDGLRGHAPRQQEVDRLLTLAQDVPGVRLGQARYEREGGRGILIVPLVNDRGAGHLAVDNWGTGALGPARVQLGYDFNGLIDDKDALSLSVMVTPAQPRELHSFWGRYARQIGHGGTEVAIYGGFGATNSGGAWRAYDANGRWVTAGLSVAQPLLRGRKVSLWLNASLDYIAVNQWFSDAMVRRDRVTTASLSLNGYMPLAGGRLRAGAGVVQGLDVLGATQAGDALASRPQADGQFTSFNAWGNWAGALVGPFSARLAVTAQLSTAPLLAVEQISVGGPAFGRAYEFAERTGDKGILGSAELQASLWDRPDGLIRWIQLYTFADAGSLSNLRNAYGTGDLYSAGLGARATLPHAFRLGIEAAFPINATRYETGDSAPRLSATATATF